MTQITRNLWTSVWQGETGREHVVTLLPVEGESAGDFLNRVDQLLRTLSGVTVMGARLYGAPESFAEVKMRKSDWGIPVSCIAVGVNPGNTLCGLQLMGIEGGTVHRLEIEGEIVGSVLTDEAGHKTFYLFGLQSRNRDSRGEQVRWIFQKTDALLRGEGMCFQQVIRTWFFLEDILSWYDQFNLARSVFFGEQNLELTQFPASTGVGTVGSKGGVVTSDMIAMSDGGPFRPSRVSSPLQDEASEYGSSFSRATEILSGSGRKLLVSGTASIDRDGRTLHQGDTRSQIERTLDVVEALLAKSSLCWSDVVSGTAFFKSADDLNLLEVIRGRTAADDLPLVPVTTDICRGDLLFELEVTACSKNP